MEQYTHQVGYLTGGTFIDPNKKEVNEVEDLLHRGFIKHAGIDKKNYESIDNFIVTDKFIKDFLDIYKKAAKEIWDIYPTKLLIQGREVDSGRVMPYDEFEEHIKKILSTDFALHAVIMNHIRQTKAANGGYASVGITKYILSKQWEASVNTKPRSATY